MAKIKPAGSKKGRKMPKAPGAVPCLFLLISLFALLGVMLYYSFSK